MEQKVEIQTPDNRVIYGTRNWQENAGDSLIIFVHGLGGDQNRHLHYNAAYFFPQHGYTTFRFNLYDRAEDARKLHECSITTHADDINTVVAHLKKDYGKIYLVGHSLAGPSIIYSNQDVAAAILWDPSIVLDPSQQLSWEEITPGGDYFVKYGTYTLVSRALHDQWAETGLPMVAQMKIPTKIITAGEGPLYSRWEQVLDQIPVAYEYTAIEGAGHGFDEEGTAEQLYLETLNWLQKY